ncbi:MAG: hypothetical protein IT580_09990 [Verrucomicrobiales bacterium]|nr:hypothetical protein [Verrucomicrobiales bacterium]
MKGHSAWCRRVSRTVLGLVGLGIGLVSTVRGVEPTSALGLRDLEADTWVATDGLGRSLPTYAEVGPARPDRTVAMFYFLWHGEHIQGGPYDVSRILAADPGAMGQATAPGWGPLHAPHHWGESLFGYYLTNDEAVLRKHAQMLSDAGVDVVIFDVTNQVTYRDWYRALLRVWAGERARGNPTPQVAFLTPFWDPARVVRELWRDLYSVGLESELWFRWEGRPLILADPELLDAKEDQAKQDRPVELEPGHALGQTITVDRAFRGVGARFPTWRSAGAAVTLTLMREGPGGERLASQRFHEVTDNAWLVLRMETVLPPGRYYLEATEPGGRIGWWSHAEDVDPRGAAFDAGSAVAGDRTWRVVYDDPEVTRCRDFFTFRVPQPDYFKGPTRPGMWSWLEVSPQHVFRDAQGGKEQMSVGVAQNAVDGRLGSMSERGARGRSFHGGARDMRPGAVRLGLNFAEQWERALAEDPRLVFVTGWNEWIAGRFAEFNGVREPVMFVDQFDQEHSRDLEPMRGGHGDDYLWQFHAAVRRYKGVRPIPEPRPGRIRVDGQFRDWADVGPEYRDSLGDAVRREHRGWDPKVIYRDASGRNDVVSAKVSLGRYDAAFYVRCAAELSPSTGAQWMVLYLDLDAEARTGWLGYDAVVNRVESGVLERWQPDARGGEPGWQRQGRVRWQARGAELELSVPWSALGLKKAPARLDFKWADHCGEGRDWSEFTLHGDAAPNDRFNYRVQVAGRARAVRSDGGR